MSMSCYSQDEKYCGGSLRQEVCLQTWIYLVSWVGGLFSGCKWSRNDMIKSCASQLGGHGFRSSDYEPTAPPAPENLVFKHLLYQQAGVGGKMTPVCFLAAILLPSKRCLLFSTKKKEKKKICP